MNPTESLETDPNGTAHSDGYLMVWYFWVFFPRDPLLCDREWVNNGQQHRELLLFDRSVRYGWKARPPEMQKLMRRRKKVFSLTRGFGAASCKQPSTADDERNREKPKKVAGIHSQATNFPLLYSVSQRLTVLLVRCNKAIQGALSIARCR